MMPISDSFTCESTALSLILLVAAAETGAAGAVTGVAGAGAGFAPTTNLQHLPNNRAMPNCASVGGCLVGGSPALGPGVAICHV
jgi:hypothetical protein